MSAHWSTHGLGDWDEESEQKIRRKRHKPKGQRLLSDLTADEAGEVADETVTRLISLGHISEVLYQLGSGKEATTYVVQTPRGAGLLKIYRDFAARSFKNDQMYREGQVILDARAKRAMEGRSRRGLAMLQADWVSAEYAHLWRLWNAGLHVPEPLVGPSVKDCAETVPAVLMRLIGTPEAPAPRLSDLSLTPEQAQRAWQQALRGMADLLRLGYVHGDYSTYNLLQHEDTMTIIDFPQMTTRQNPNFSELLRRDAQSISTNFRKYGLQQSGEDTLREVQRLAARPAPEPRLRLP